MMMSFPKKEVVEAVRAQFPEGTKVELVHMDDAQAPPVGTKGIVSHVDDIATVHIVWENGSSLGAVYGEDVVRII